MSIPKICLALALGFTTCAPAPDAEEATDQLTNLDAATLLAIRADLRAGETEAQAAYRALLTEADSVLTAPLYSVTHKTTVPPSGDKRDYLSLGPYWWPDTTKADSLPWIRRDGEVNPLTQGENVDRPRMRAAFNNIETLALAAFFSGEERYAARAREQINVWFLDPATRMNPHLTFGQGIPGRNTGRGIGIIETTALGRVINAAELLRLSEQLPTPEAKTLDAWFKDFLHWLQTSEMGIAEREWHNNHGTWYDVQVVALLRHLGREDEAREVLRTAREKRIAVHLAPDGSQPHELKRTKSLSYSTMNLRALTRLAYHGKRLGVDLWNYRPEDGGSLPDAYAYLRPFAFTDKPWPYPQLGSIAKVMDGTRRLFFETGATLGLNAYCKEIDNADLPPAHRYHLLYVCPNS